MRARGPPVVARLRNRSCSPLRPRPTPRCASSDARAPAYQLLAGRIEVSHGRVAQPSVHAVPNHPAGSSRASPLSWRVARRQGHLGLHLRFRPGRPPVGSSPRSLTTPQYPRLGFGAPLLARIPTPDRFGPSATAPSLLVEQAGLSPAGWVRCMAHMKAALFFKSAAICGVDGTRTRALRRDRPTL